MERAFGGPAKVLRPLRAARPRRDRRRRAGGVRRPVRHARRRSTATAAPWPAACRRWPPSSSTTTAATPRASGPTPTPAPDAARGGSGRCPASASRRPGSSPPCWASSSACARRAGGGAGAYAEDGSYRSVADVVDAESLQKVRAFKKAAKAATARASRGQEPSGMPTEQRPIAPVCATCGAGPPDEEAAARARMSWARGVETGREVWTCDGVQPAPPALHRGQARLRVVVTRGDPGGVGSGGGGSQDGSMPGSSSHNDLAQRHRSAHLAEDPDAAEPHPVDEQVLRWQVELHARRGTGGAAESLICAADARAARPG